MTITSFPGALAVPAPRQLGLACWTSNALWKFFFAADSNEMDAMEEKLCDTDHNLRMSA